MKQIKVYLRSYNNEKTGMVWVQFYLQREKVHFSTKVTCDTRHWNEKRERVGTGDKLASDKNLIIENILSRINDVLVKYRLKDRKLTKEAFLRAYNRPDDYPTFHDYAETKMKQYSYQIEDSTLKGHRMTLDKLKRFDSGMTFDDVDHEMLDRFFSYLRKIGNNENTAYKNMTNLKKYVLAAWREGYIDCNPFQDWKIRKSTASCIYLSEQELDKLLLLYKEGELKPNLHRTLEFFLFLCFSSLHVGDALRLQLEQFGERSFTYYRLKLRHRKPEPIIVPISDPLRSILKNVVGLRKRGPVFENPMKEQVMNRYLKSIAEIAGIKKRLTHKVGRHTFATIYLRKTKDLASLKEILGHSDLHETMVYAHVMDETKQECIQCFNSFEV